MHSLGTFWGIILGRRESIGGTVYGTIIVMATIAAGAHGGSGTWDLAVVVAVSVLVLWIAHVYSNGLAESLQRGRRLDTDELLEVARHEFAMPLAGVAPIAALVLAAAGVLGDVTGVRLALGFGVATLAFQGLRYAALEHMRPLGAVLSIAFNVMLGLTIVVLEAAIH
jgi:hypothetical protein